jgi:hypothetical protein
MSFISKDRLIDLALLSVTSAGASLCCTVGTFFRGDLVTHLKLDRI